VCNEYVLSALCNDVVDIIFTVKYDTKTWIKRFEICCNMHNCAIVVPVLVRMAEAYLLSVNCRLLSSFCISYLDCLLISCM